MNEPSILRLLEQQGLPAPRVRLKGTERQEAARSRYEFKGEIARGGVGIIHRGHDNDVGRDVALKVLRPEHLNNPELVQRFLDEAQIGGQLQHPSILPVFELGLQPDNRPFFAMRLVKGQTLAARLAQRTDSNEDLRELLRIFRQTCLAVHYAHSRGVVHRDLKPSNIMIGAFGEVQVVDWGFAKVMRNGGVDDERLAQRAARDETMITTQRETDGPRQSRTGTILGTPAYMPPEQALGRVDELDARSDVFSLGALLCEILTGAPPYDGTEDEQLRDAANARLEPAVARLAECAAGVRVTELCRRCLQPLRRDRANSAQVLADEVDAHLGEAERRSHEALLRAARAQARAEAQRRTRRQILFSTAAALLVVALGMTAYLLHKNDATERQRGYREALDTALRDTTRLRAAGDWDGALAAANRAAELGHAGGLAAEIRAESQTAVDKARREREDAALLAEMEVVRSRAQRGLDPSGPSTSAGLEVLPSKEQEVRTEAAYDKLIGRRFGSLAKAIPRLRSSVHATAFAAHLDFWAHTRRRVDKESDWREIDRASRMVDPTHTDVRDAIRDEDLERLLGLVNQPGSSLPLPLAVNVAESLILGQRSAEAIALLKQHHLRHPDDYWINSRLALAARAARDFALSARHNLAALTVRPEDATMWADYAVALFSPRASGRTDREGALRIYEHALALANDDGMALHNIASGMVNIGEMKFDRAAKLYRRAAELNPKGAVGLRSLTHVLIRTGEMEEAEATIRRGLALAPDDRRTKSLLSNVLRLGGAIDEATILARELVADAPDDAIGHASLGMVLAEAGETTEAMVHLKRAATLEPDLNSTILILQGWSRLKRPAETVAASRVAAGRFPNCGAVLILLGGALNEHRKFHEAIQVFRRVIDLNWNQGGAHCSLGAALASIGNYAEAHAEVDKELALRPDYADAYRVRGWVYSRQDRPADAIAPLRRALELGCTNQTTVRDDLASALSTVGDHRGAEQLFREVLASAPETPGVGAKLAYCALVLGRPAEAIPAFEKHLREYPQDGKTAMLLAIALQQTGKQTRAIELHRQALLKLEDPSNLVHVAKNVRALGQIGIAREALAKALLRRPTDPVQLVALGAELSNCMLLPAAVEVLEEALERDPMVPHGRHFLGVTWKSMGRTEDAERALIRALEEFPDNQSTQAGAARHLFAIGKVERASIALQRARALGDHPTIDRFTRLCDAAKRARPDQPVELNAADSIEVAVSLYHQHRSAASATMYAQAFDKNSQLADDLIKQHRYNAACAAALADTARWRKQAVAWLNADLQTYTQFAQSSPNDVRVRLEHWLSDSDLVTVRDGAKLPADAEELWRRVRDLLDGL